MFVLPNVNHQARVLTLNTSSKVDVCVYQRYSVIEPYLNGPFAVDKSRVFTDNKFMAETPSVSISTCYMSCFCFQLRCLQKPQ